MNRHKMVWEEHLVTKHSRGLDGQLILDLANQLMTDIRSAAGDQAHEQYHWYRSNQKSLIQRFHIFSPNAKEHIAAHGLVLDQLSKNWRSEPLDPELVNAYMDEIRAEAMIGGNNTASGAMQWLDAHAEARLELTNVPDRAHWPEYFRAWGSVHKQLGFELRKSRKIKSVGRYRRFQDVWEAARAISPGTRITNWTRRRGPTGEPFTVLSSSAKAIVFDVPRAKSKEIKAPRHEFEFIWGLWDAYRADEVSRSKIVGQTFHSKYIISTLKYLEDEGDI